LFIRQWLFLCAALLSLGALLAWSLYDEHNKIDIRERERLSASTRIIDENLSRQLLATNLAIDSIRKDLPFLRAETDGKAQIDRRLQAMNDAMPGVRALLIIDAEGNTTASTRKYLVGQNFGDRAYFKTARESRNPAMLHVSAPFKTTLGFFAISVVKMIPDEKGGFAGIISVTLSNEYFSTLLESVRYAPEMRTYIAHTDGNLLLSVPSLPNADGADLARPGSFFKRHRDSGQKSTVMTGLAYVNGVEQMNALITIKPDSFPMDKALVVGIGRRLGGIFADWRKNVFAWGGLFGLLVLSATSGLYLYQHRQRAYATLLTKQLAERKVAEEALKARDELFRNLFDRAIDGIFIASSSGQLIAVNESFARMHGYAIQELQRMGLKDLDTPDTFRLMPERMSRIMSGEALMFEVEHVHKDGHVFPLEVSASLICAGSEPLIQCFHRDITERRQAEAQIRLANEDLHQINQTLESRVLERTLEIEAAHAMLEASAQDLARSNKDLEQFAYVASHDLQEPVRTVVGFVQLLERRLSGKVDAEAAEFMSHAVNSALHMKRMIQDILAYSRVGTKGAPHERVDTASVAQDALILLGNQISDSGAEVEVFSLPTVYADRTQVVQLFQNLIGNAIKFCQEGTPRVRIAAQRDGDQWRFTITDNGVGIAVEYRESVFDIFQRLHTRNEYEGTGIGLAVCKRIIERHGGEIGVDAAPGGGSVFWFTLPADKSG
jgi:PAS domain S-box-containing protein